LYRKLNCINLMFVYFFIHTSLAHIKIITFLAFVSCSNYRTHFAQITYYIFMDLFIFLFLNLILIDLINNLV